METIDKRRIKKITIKYPELCNRDAEELIAAEYFNLISLDDRIHNLRTLINSLEVEYNKAKKEFEDKQNLFTIEFETKKFSEVKGECNLNINNRSDARNKSYGSN